MPKTKIEITSKASLKLTSRINLGRRDARAEPPTLDTAYNPPPPPSPQCPETAKAGEWLMPMKLT